jgi:hypothetical protein
LFMATAAIGAAVSIGTSALSGALTPTKNTFNEQVVGKLENVSTRKTGAGWTLSKVYGRVQIQGCPIFWAPQRREEVTISVDTQTTRTGGIFGIGAKSSTTTNQTTTYKYFGTFAFAICDGAAEIDVRQIKFNDKIWFNRDGQLDGTIADNDYKLENYIKIYTGASNQNIDPTIQNYEGNQNGDRNFRHLVYAVVTDLPLDEFGGELPSNIDVIVKRESGICNRIDQVIYEVAETVGLVRGVDIKCDNIVDQYPRINAIFKQDGGTAADFINELVQRHFLLTYLDDDGAIVFNGPGEVQTVTAGSWGDLGAVEYGSEPGDPYSEIMPDESELPSSVTLSFTNLSDDFNSDNETKIYPLAKHYNPKSISSALFLMPDEAKWWVWKYLEFAWAQARRFTINLLPEDAVTLTEAFRYSFPLSEGTSAIPFQIASIVVGSNLVAEVEVYEFNGQVFTAQLGVSSQTNVAYNGGVIQLTPNIINPPTVTSADGATTYVQGVDYTVNLSTGQITIIGGSSITTGDDLTIIYLAEPDYTVNTYNPESEQPNYGNVTIEVVETNRISVGDVSCIYAAISGDGDRFGQNVIYARINGGNYEPVVSVINPTTQGSLSGTLPLATGLDITNTATVVLSKGTLDQLTQNEFDNKEIILLIGSEQIVARDVNLVSGNTYELSYLQRGVNGTIPVSHSDGESVYLANGGIGELLLLPINADTVGQTIDLKVVPSNLDLASVTTVVSHVVEGIYFKPYTVSNVTSTKDSAGNITINWTANNTGAGSLTPQSFDIDIYDGVDIVRTLSSSEATVKYLASEQVIDFGVTQSTLNIDLYQLSTEYGRGYVFTDVLSPILSNPVPTVLGFSPTQGGIGREITIYGSGFTSATTAAINGISVDSFTVVSDGVINGAIGSGTTTGKVTVTNPTGTGQSLTDFVIITSAVDWGDIGGTLADQTDLQTALNSKFNNPTGTTSQYLRGDGSLQTFPTIPTQPTTVKTFGSYNSTTPTVSTIYLFTATTTTTINELRGLKTTSGTCTLSIQINGVNVTGLTNLNVNSTPQNPTASGASVASVGQDVTLVISAVSTPNKLQFTLGATLPLT